MSAARPPLGPPLGPVAGALVAVVLAGCSDESARCRAEVAASFERLRTSGVAYRKETTIKVGDHQVFAEIAEYIPPDRMHTVTTNRVREQEADGVRVPGFENNSEVVRVGARAWAKAQTQTQTQTGWREWEPWLVRQLYSGGMDFLLLPNRVVPADATFECLGVVVFKGDTYLGYRSRIAKSIAVVVPTSPKAKEALEAKVRHELQQMPQHWRTVLVDQSTGLPVYDLVAAQDRLDAPRSSVHFSYPAEMKIDPPVQ